MFVREVRARDILPIPEEMPFKKILETVSCFRHLYYPVVNIEREVIGMLRRSDVQAVYNREILVSKLKT